MSTRCRAYWVCDQAGRSKTAVPGLGPQERHVMRRDVHELNVGAITEKHGLRALEIPAVPLTGVCLQVAEEEVMNQIIYKRFLKQVLEAVSDTL